MDSKNKWLLPEGIDEVLPPQAAQLNHLCRELIDLYASWGYELVMPPLVEYLDSLLTGTGSDLDLQTFKLTDQLTGRMMGVRADTTPQVARIDNHNLKRDMPTRLCYFGEVLHTRPANPAGTRMPLQAGAELYGHAGVESDAEILSLMLKTLQVAGIQNVHVDLGHVGIYRGLIGKLAITAEQESVIFDVLQRKATAELMKVINDWSLPSELSDMLLALIELNGGIEILNDARLSLAKAGKDVLHCIDELEQIAELSKGQIKNAPLYFDLAELRGYHYHTGMMCTAYVPGLGQGIAFGGRYDDIGQSFGRARPATGFSTDIRKLFALVPRPDVSLKRIFAPSSDVPGLNEAIDRLREQGEVVICELTGQQGDAKQMGCDRKLVLEGGSWKVEKL